MTCQTTSKDGWIVIKEMMLGCLFFQNLKCPIWIFFRSDHRAVKISLFHSSTSRGVDSRRNSKFLFDPIWMTNGEFKEVIGVRGFGLE